jgi:hypothetical protein
MNIVEKIFDIVQLFVLLCDHFHGCSISLLCFLIFSLCSQCQLTTSG